MSFIQANTTIRFQALTGFRCLAACLVFLYHNRKYWRDVLPTELMRLFNELNIGVSLFFTLSGFLIAFTYSDKPLQSVKGYGRYILLRGARIFPLYWLILTAYYCDPRYGQFHFSLTHYSLVHAFSNKHNLEGIAQAWSLNVEMVFYFLAPFLFYLQRRHWGWLFAFLIAFFLTSWGLGTFWHRLNGNPHQYFYPLKFLLSGSFAGRSLEFAAGVLMASALKSDGGKRFQQIPHKTLIGFVGILLTTYLVGWFQPDIYHHGTDSAIGRIIQTLFLPLFTVLALTGLISENTWTSQFFSSRIMVLLGNSSYAFYLVHISYVSLKLREWTLWPDRNFILLWGISILIYLLFEKPVYDFFRRHLKR